MRMPFHAWNNLQGKYYEAEASEHCKTHDWNLVKARECCYTALFKQILRFYEGRCPTGQVLL